MIVTGSLMIDREDGMGWDANAIYDDHRRGYVNTCEDKIAAGAFRKAADDAHLECKYVDAGLEHGGLDVSDYVRALAEIAGERDKYAIWNSDRVKALFNSIEWPNPDFLPEPRRGHVVCAREFMRACAEHGYGIHFDP